MNFEIILFLVHALIVLGKPAHQDEGMSFTVKHSGMKKKKFPFKKKFLYFLDDTELGNAQSYLKIFTRTSLESDFFAKKCIPIV